MKDINVDTIGGRIRACRKTMDLTLAEMSKAIGVSANYISVVERNEKNPSDKVLHKIASLASVSYWWLKTGQEKSPVKLQEPGSHMDTVHANIVIPVNVDVPLFLALAVQSIPGMTKERLAAKLDVPVETMEKTLFGGKYTASPDWTGYFQVLARRMDLPAVCRKIYDLGLFLQNEMREKNENPSAGFPHTLAEG